MKLYEYSIDDLHVIATAELEQEKDTVDQLHALYAQLREQYIKRYMVLRKEALLS
jgi:hypothetical protein